MTIRAVDDVPLTASGDPIMPARLLLVAALLAATLAGARADAQPARLGVYVGSSIASLSEQGGPVLDGLEIGLERKRRIGLQLGVWLNRPLAGRLSLQPELHYTQKGASYAASFFEPGEGTFEAEVSLELSYLELPVLLRADLGRASGRVRPFIVAGPVLAYQTGCRIGFELAGFGGFGGSEDCDAEVESNEQINTFDVGAAVGGGLAVRRGGRELTAGVRYTHGLRSLARSGENVTNRNVSVLFGLGF
jgi:hypothetical protein